jgi:hypothetical protein
MLSVFGDARDRSIADIASSGGQRAWSDMSIFAEAGLRHSTRFAITNGLLSRLCSKHTHLTTQSMCDEW